MIVMYHFGGFPWVTGHNGVYAFFTLSGYLMTMVLDRVYSKLNFGTIKYYGNRALRILPLYAFYMLVTVGLAYLREKVGFTIDPGKPEVYLINPSLYDFNVFNYLKEFIFNVDYSNLLSYLKTGGNGLVFIPQAWSLATEFIFYLSAPFLLYAFRKKRYVAIIFLASIGYVAWTLATGKDFDNFCYKSIMGSYYAFIIGAVLYKMRDRLPTIPNPKIYFFASISLWLFVAILSKRVNNGGSFLECFFALIILQTFTTYVVTQPTKLSDWQKKLDTVLGNLSYGVFLAHFISAFLLLWLTDYLRPLTGSAYPIGRADTFTFGVLASLLTIIIATFGYFAVERPVNQLRDKLRN
jgi:peptidoglycan/LPS O-acetylase OafA/YrhL